MGDPGRLIAFEGVEGAGKSTQLELLRRALEGRSPEVVVTREPGGTPAGERIRALLLDPQLELHPRAEALLFAAARAELVEAVIRPALERGAVVLCDRYLDSSLAYQGEARGLGRDPVEQVNREFKADWDVGEHQVGAEVGRSEHSFCIAVMAYLLLSRGVYLSFSLPFAEPNVGCTSLELGDIIVVLQGLLSWSGTEESIRHAGGPARWGD